MIGSFTFKDAVFWEKDLGHFCGENWDLFLQGEMRAGPCVSSY